MKTIKMVKPKTFRFFKKHILVIEELNKFLEEQIGKEQTIDFVLAENVYKILTKKWINKYHLNREYHFIFADNDNSILNVCLEQESRTGRYRTFKILFRIKLV